MATNTLTRPEYGLVLDDLASVKWSWPKATIISAYLKSFIPVAFVVVLAALVLRIIFGLFLIEGAFAQDVNSLTEPIVYPFQGLFLYENDMLQAPTFAAFSFYYCTYLALGKFFRWYHARPQQNVPNLGY